MDQYLVLTISGLDRPGTTSGVTQILSAYPVSIAQLQQIVLQNELVLGLTLKIESPANFEMLQSEIDDFVTQRGMTLRITKATSSTPVTGEQNLLVTVLGDPLTPNAVAAITGAIASHGANIDRIRQVAEYPVTAIEFQVAGVALDELRSSLASVARSNAIDIAVQPATLDRRGVQLVVLDVDSTIIQQEVIDVLASYAGVSEQVSEITHLAMNGELDFAQSLARRVALLRGLSAQSLVDVRSDIDFTPGAATLCRTLKRLGFHVALVSGGFIEVVEPLAAELGVTDVRANRLEIVDGKLTGRVLGGIVDAEEKKNTVERVCAELGLTSRQAIVMGDGANDLKMMGIAGMSVAFRAKPVVRAQANVALNFVGLDGILPLFE